MWDEAILRMLYTAGPLVASMPNIGWNYLWMPHMDEGENNTYFKITFFLFHKYIFRACDASLAHLSL